jgi:glucose/arabinose dehydrogenase
VARGELDAAATALTNVTVIFRQTPKRPSTDHYGSRLVFRDDGTLFVTLGERDSFRTEAQDIGSQLGKVVRINTDGTLPADNPFAAQGGLAAAVWTYGNRNPQAAALHPLTRELWVTEHGPQGGDEVNLALPGRNFGWPIVSYGCEYGATPGEACRIGGGTHAGFFEPLIYWWPQSTAPGGMAFYTGSQFPERRNNLFVGGLNGQTLWRFVLDGSQINGVERLFSFQEQIRDVRQGPDGGLYIVSRSSEAIFRVERQ